MGKRWNLARFFVEHAAIGYCLLMIVLAWGVFGYETMSKRKDPEIPVRVAVAVTAWPGASAESVEKLVTQKVEDAVAGNVEVETIRSISRPNVSIVFAELSETVGDTGKQFDDVKVKLDQVRDLPDGAGPVQFIKDFGDTAAVMLTVASPKADPVEVRLISERASALLTQVRRGSSGRRSTVWRVPHLDELSLAQRVVGRLAADVRDARLAEDVREFSGDGLVGIDYRSSHREPLDDAESRATGSLRELDPDTWAPVHIDSLEGLRAAMDEVAGDKYTYRQLDKFTEQLEKGLKRLPIVSKITRSGILPEVTRAYYSQQRLVATEVTPAAVFRAVQAANSTVGSGELTGSFGVVPLHPLGPFENLRNIQDLTIGVGASGSPIHLGDIATVSRGYQSPARYLNDFTYRDAKGAWQRSKAITLSIQMKSGAQILEFGSLVDKELVKLRSTLPQDLVIARTSDQPQQVGENLVGLFVTSLGEAILLVVLVSLIGFWDWRTALMMGAAIPITLALTFGVMRLMGLDLQQVSVATLILALGLLVDMPVVAGDGIKRSLAEGRSPKEAAWLGPVRLIKVLAYATFTNVAAYLPFLMLSGNTGRYLYTLPVVITISLLAALVVSATFIPLLGKALYRHAHGSVRNISDSPFGQFYLRLVTGLVKHRWLTLGVAALFFLTGGAFFARLPQQFFPHDLAYLSYIDVWLPQGSSLSRTDDLARQVEREVLSASEGFAKDHPGELQGKGAVRWLTSFIGGGGPRFWFSVEPELQQLNYAQILIQTHDKHITAEFDSYLQERLDRTIAGGRADVKMLETGKPVGIPDSIRISGPEIGTLARLAEEAKDIYRSCPIARGITDDWNGPAPAFLVHQDSEKAALSGLSEEEVAASAGTSLSGAQLSNLRQNDEQLPIQARLAPEERDRAQDLNDLYVFSAEGPVRAPIGSVSSLMSTIETANIRRRDRVRTVTVGASPTNGYLASQVMKEVRPKLDAFIEKLPTGYSVEIAGEQREQDSGFKELAAALAVSVLAIYMMLVLQLGHLAKPFVVFSAIPCGIAGAMFALWLGHAPFGFMAFTGVASLIGVIVSHIIVLIEFIEERRGEGMPLVQALADAGVQRLRPVMITVAATVFGLVPLALHGGPLWVPLCYAQIGGLSVATFVTLLLTPTLYAIFVRDLHLIDWRPNQGDGDEHGAGTATA
jgi:multidrug efflux pump subunit AcrB